MSTMPAVNNPPGSPSFPTITPGTFQKRTLSGSSQQSAAFQVATTVLYLVTDTDCYVAFGSNPVADTSSMYLVAKVPYYVGVTPGQKLAALQAGSGGNLYITEGA